MGFNSGFKGLIRVQQHFTELKAAVWNIF